MKKEIDPLNEHYLLPAVLALGLFSIIIGAYYLNEWHEVSQSHWRFAFYDFSNPKEAEQYANKMGKWALTFLATGLLGSLTLILKSRWSSFTFILLAFILLGVLI